MGCIGVASNRGDVVMYEGVKLGVEHEEVKVKVADYVVEV
jgi:hypothetical protein